jgi:ribosomal protein S12 methylthiotransferase accessory factor
MPSTLDQPQWLGTVARGDRGRKGHSIGTHRLVPPEETVARVQALMAPMGITRIANVTGLDRIGIPVVMVCRPNARSIAVSQGKGLDLAAATASGLMESVETFHAERIDRPLKLASRADLADGHAVIDVAGLPRAAGDRFHEHLPILWIEGRDLLGGGTTWLPYETVHANYTLPQPAGSGCFAASTNGLASGNHPLEAICHAIAEIIERDATAGWYRLGKRERDRTRLDLDSVDDPACCAVLAQLRAAGFAVAAWDTRGRVGVPSFYGVISDERRPLTHPGAGAGCHPSPRIALLRALLEAVQVRTTYIAGARDDIGRAEYGPSAIERKLRNLRALTDDSGTRRRFAEITGVEQATFAEDLDYLLAQLGAAGVRQVAVVDLTSERFGLPVMRAVIPGLDAFDEEAGGG